MWKGCMKGNRQKQESMKVKPLNRERNNNKSSRHNNVQLAIIMLLTSLLFVMGSHVNH